MTNRNRIVLEHGTRSVVASVLDWPGWSWGGRSEEHAIRGLLGYAGRYRAIADRAGVNIGDKVLAPPNIVERIACSSATDFGVPYGITTAEYLWMTQAECERQIALLEACSHYFDDAANSLSETLCKGPRGGGRDPDA